MRKDKIRAYELRRKGKSYSEIGKVLGVPKSTLSGWFKEELWSQEIKEKLGQEESTRIPKKLNKIIQANRKRWALWHQSHRDKAEQEYKILKKNLLFIAGLMLYWGEGDNNSKISKVRLANSDPGMIRVFYKFLNSELGIPSEKIYASLLLYPDLKDDMQKSFWSRAIGLPLTQFKKSTYIRGRDSDKRRSYGVCNIYVNSGGLKEKILTWIRLYQNEI